MAPDIFWMAFLGLVAAMTGCVALFEMERQRSLTQARLSRANGTAQTRRSQKGKQDQRKFLAGLRHAVAQIGERLAVVLGGEARETAADLASAGFRSRDALLIYAFLKTILPLIAVIAGLIWLLLSYPIGIEMVLPGAAVIATALGLSKGVDFVLDHMRSKRLDQIRRGFPDMLELLVISSEAGLGPQPALHRVASELTLTHPALALEVLQMVSEMRLTNDRRAAYAKLNARIPLPEIGVFTQTLDQSDTYGTPFSSAMRTLIAEQRSNRLMWIEEKAARLPVLMTLPLIFCIMPAVFVVLVGPAALSVFDNILSGG
ncbi:Type II secretion system protein [Sulfitobacter noctilucae]|uniref:type II secretion system F family protein n=1 Tax=Sulfitobacter noctilucae TaxID=1342302 RepID=UPI0004689BDC|nr:type II secretion system F family protein [Sulfitobacter noctilucae]KIN70665.1 Type II secretion system protein [Sulfitobacter noctilucae]